jgi:drug/metabolite transporter (DMT)-like permease
MLKRIHGEYILLFASLIWGTSFIFQSIAMASMGPYLFVTVRSLIASVVMGVVIVIRPWIVSGKKIKNLGTTKGYFLAIISGLSLIIAMTLQQVGIVGTTAGKAGFLTTLYIIFVPLLGLIIGRLPPKSIYISAPLAVIGFYFLSVQSNFGVLNQYDVLILLSALFYAIQIMVIDLISKHLDSLMFSFVQFTVSFLISLIPTFIFEGITFDFLFSAEAVYALLYVGILSSCVAYTLQIVGQKRAKNASSASLIMSLEAIFATLAGVLFLNEVITWIQFLGMVLIFIAILLIQLPLFDKKNKSKTIHPSNVV